MLSVLYFVLALGLLIFIHELGHYVAAKIVGIPIQEFGIGFPPKILTLFTVGGTDFTLNWLLPFGGFVRPKERPGDMEIPDEAMAAKPLKRIIFLLAGSFTNIVAAVLMLAFAYYQIGNKLDHILIVGVDDGSPAAEVGLMAEDQIVSFAGVEIESIDQLQALVQDNKGEETTLTYLRGDETFSVTLVPRTEFDPVTEGPLGVALYAPVGVLGAIQNSVSFLIFQVQQLTQLPFRLVGLKGMFDGFQLAQDMDATGSSVSSGSNTIWFLASISFSLGLINLLPIPLFDGGKILLAIPELIVKRRVPINLYYMLNMVSLGLVIMLMIYVNIQDFINPSIDLIDLTPTP